MKNMNRKSSLRIGHHSSQTNVEFVVELMEVSNHGPLAQLFVLDALEKWSDKIIASEAEVVSSMEKSFINGEAWVSVAREIKAKLEARYARTGSTEIVS